MGNEESAIDKLRRIAGVVRQYSTATLTEQVTEASAQQWLDAGFDDGEEIGDWLRAGCDDAQGAQSLEARGITPEQAALRTIAGTKDYEETIGRKIINGDLSFDEAQRIITNAFWNS